jgi:hypothetical protein
MAINAMQAFNPLEFGLNAGLGTLGGLFSWLGDAGNRKIRKEGVNIARDAMGRMKGMIGKDVLNVPELTGQIGRSMVPEINRRGESINRSLGLDSGVGQTALWSPYVQELASKTGEMTGQNAVMKSQRDNEILRFLAQNAFINYGR